MIDDYKIHARLRRQKMMELMADGYDFTTRVVPPKKTYKRIPKHRPQTASEWEKVELWP